MEYILYQEMSLTIQLPVTLDTYVTSAIQFLFSFFLTRYLGIPSIYIKLNLIRATNKVVLVKKDKENSEVVCLIGDLFGLIVQHTLCGVLDGKNKLTVKCVCFLLKHNLVDILIVNIFYWLSIWKQKQRCIYKLPMNSAPH